MFVAAQSDFKVTRATTLVIGSERVLMDQSQVDAVEVGAEEMEMILTIGTDALLLLSLRVSAYHACHLLESDDG